MLQQYEQQYPSHTLQFNYLFIMSTLKKENRNQFKNLISIKRNISTSMLFKIKNPPSRLLKASGGSYFCLIIKLLNQCCNYKRNHTHKLYQNIQRRTRSIFEWVANGIACNSCFMRWRTFSAKVPRFNILLCIIP